VICLSACLFLDPFQQYLEVSVIFGLSIYTASVKNYSVGNGNVLLEFFLWGGDSNDKVGLQVTAEKMKISSYLHVGKCPYPWDVS
jgi:hypothetical protein